ncbi:MAG: CHAD domain-containing protein [Rhodospirillales bacterium]|nr:CHAD domain-containing protein [Rhodospirillales bacterium]
MEQPTTLRLEISPDDAARLLHHPAVTGPSPARPTTRRAGSVFFDTPDRQLWSAGVMIEVRSTGQRHVQVVRADGAMIEGARVNLTWENPLPSAEPDPSAIADTRLRRLVTPLPGTRLEPVLSLDLRRTTRRLVPEEGQEILLILHNGQASGGAAGHPVCEVELFQKAGPPARLFELARAIQADVPLRVATEPLERRLLRQAAGEMPAWRKAVPLDLPGEASVEDALALILGHCLDHLTDNEAATRLGDHPEGVHQMRVALRRLRSALRVFRPILPAEPYRWIDEETRWLTQSLGDARDLDVFEDEIVGPVAAAFPDEPAFATLLAALAARRRLARAAARQAIESERFTRLLLDLRAWMAGRAWRNQPVSETASQLFQPITGLATPLLSARFKKVRKSGRRFAELTPAERHKLRIAVKKLRYATDFFSSLYGRKRVRAFTSALQELQDGLGYINDVTVARTLIERLEKEAGDAAPAVRQAGAILLGWHTRAAAEAAGTLEDEIKRLLAGKPFWLTAPGEETPC